MRAAQLLSIVLHPAVPGFFVALHATLAHEGGLTARLVAIAALVTFACVGAPISSLALASFLGYTRGDLWGERRETRVLWFYPAATIGLVATYFIFDRLYVFPLARSMVVAAGGVTLLLAAANRWLKPSIHVAGNAAIAAAAAWTYGAIVAPLFLLIPLVAWARVRAEKHTIAETLVGAAVGLTVTLAALTWVA